MRKKKSHEHTPAPRRFKPYLAYKYSGIEWLGEIPVHWTALPARRLIGRIEQGWSPVAEDRQAEPDEWAVIKVGAVKHGRFLPGEHKALPADLTPDTRYEIREGDFLLTRANTPDLVGDACVVRGMRPKLMLCDLVYRLRLQDQRLDPAFLAYWFGSRVGRYQIEIDARGASLSMVKISQGHIRAWTVILPPLEEQRAIAAFLDRETARIDALVAKKERLIELLREKRTALISRVVTKGLDPNVPMKDSGVEWLGTIPAHWKCLALAHVTVSRCDGPFGSSLKSEHYSALGVRVIRLQNIGWAEFSSSDEAYIDESYAKELGDHSVVPGDLLIAGLGDEGHPVGRACVAPADIGPAMVKADCFRFRLDRRKLLPGFAAYQLSATAAAAAGSFATGATRSRMNLTTTAARKIALPPIDEQKAIVDMLDRAGEKLQPIVAKIREAMDRLKELRTALISAAVTGKIDVREEVS
jgi:type I restriction enzyme S subunit